MRIRSVSPTDEGQQQQLYDRRLHVHHQRHIRHQQQQLLQKQIVEDQEQHRHYDRHTSASLTSINGSRPEGDTLGSTSSLHEAFHHRATTSSHHHQHHHRFFGTAAASHHQPPSSVPTMPGLIEINQSTAALSLPPPLAPIPPSSSALEQHIQAIYVAAAVAAAAHSASRGGHTSSSLIGSVNSTSGPCRDVHQHHVRSSSMNVGTGHHTQHQQPTGSVFGEQINHGGVRPEVVELNACLVGGRTACGGRMLMKQDSSSASYDQLLIQGANYDSLAVISFCFIVKTGVHFIIIIIIIIIYTKCIM